MDIEKRGLLGLHFSEEKRKVPLSHYRIIRSHLISKSTFKDENHIDTVKPGTLLGFSKNGHWYFEDIKYNHLQEFLKQHKIYWNLIVKTDVATLIIPENVAIIAENAKHYQLNLQHKNFEGFFSYLIDEWHFVIKNEEANIEIDLSKEWREFLEEFKQENQVCQPLDI